MNPSPFERNVNDTGEIKRREVTPDAGVTFWKMVRVPLLRLSLRLDV